MRRVWAAGAILASIAAGCGTTGTGHGVSVSPPIVVSSPMPPSPAASPSATTAPDGPLELGGATVSISGDLTLQVSFPTLVQPDVWGVPPAPMDLTWDEPTGQSLSLSGTSFVSRAATGADRVLTFVVTGPEGPLQFTSSSGECSVTISPALPDNMGGAFTCTAVTDVDGGTTVDARGSFSATG
jgi:hypothetical protein